MGASPVNRRLSAVLAADVVGYSRLVRADEDRALLALKEIREKIVDPTIAEHNGRIVKAMGDGLLVEYSSVADAVQSAIDIQKSVAKIQNGIPEESRIVYRMGINLSDVVIDGDDIQGDGVNVASRLEAFAAPGGVCVSGAVHEQIKNRLKFKFESMGDQQFKNINEPVQVWQWRDNVENSQSPNGQDDQSLRNLQGSQSRDEGTRNVLSRPAVLFLPFEALGKSDEDIILASGLCEDIRTTLSCWRWFPVIGPEALARQEGDIKSLAKSVGAAYVMNGSVRRSGERVRVTARLIDGEVGSELWSQYFDGDLKDVFEFQEDVSRRIVSQIEPEISHAAAARIPVSRPRDLTSWELLAKAAEEERKGGDGYGTQEANEAQRLLLLEAIENEPDLCEAWARLARCHFRDFLLGWTEDRSVALDASLSTSAHAVEIDPTHSLAQSYRSQCMLFGNHDPIGALEHAQEAVRLNPSNVSGHIMMGCVLVYCGDPEQAFSFYENAIRLNPNFPNMGAILCDQMMCRALVGNLEEAVVLAQKTMAVAPNYQRGLQRCASVFAHAGAIEEAQKILAKIEKTGGSFSEAYIRETYPFVVEKDLNFLIEGLRLAGWKG